MKKSMIVIFCILGMIIGIGIGDFFSNVEWLKWLSIGGEIGFKPFAIDLSFIEFTLGFWCKVNICGVLGMVIFAIGSKKVLDWLKI